MKTITIDGVEYYLVPKETESKWRLPTINELFNMYKREISTTIINEFIPYFCWSSTTFEDNTTNVWSVGFRHGFISPRHKDCDSFVRCVRDTKDGLVWSEFSKFKMTWDEAVEYAKNLEE